MASGGVVEIISQFAGYLHLYSETAQAQVEYDTFLQERMAAELEPTQGGPAGRKHDLDDLLSSRVSITYSDEPPTSPPFEPFEAGRDELRSDIPSPNEIIAPLDQSQLPVLAAGGALNLAILQPEITVTYSGGGNQQAIQAQQINYLSDNDVAGMSAEAAMSLQQIDTEAALEELFLQAAAETPEDLAIGQFDAGSLVPFFAERDTAWKEEGETVRGDVEPGTYLNGVLQPEGAELPSEPETPDQARPLNENGATSGEPGHNPALDVNGAEQPAQIAMLGGNQATNAALIVDVNHATGTMVVFGDYFTTDAIVQVTAYMDDDSIAHAGAGDFTIESGGNEANNVASFQETDPGVPSFAGSDIFGGLNWRVDTFNGDLYDIQSISQKSRLEDNDVSLQETYETHYQILAGANEQGNLANLNTDLGDYDLVIVTGDYHQANLVFQKILLLDPDTLKVLGGPAQAQDGEASGPSLSSGGNWLLNDATIENFGTQTFNPLTEQWEQLAEDLNNETASFDPSAGTGIPNFNDEMLDILLVNGSVYDLNLISQEIMVSDADTALQWLPQTEDGEGVSQEASTGGNSLTNIAAIVHTGPVADYYIGGDHYDEELLIQADILASDDDEVVHEDPEALATELVAFTSQQTGEGEDPQEEFAPVNDSAQGDVLGGTLA